MLLFVYSNRETQTVMPESESSRRTDVTSGGYASPVAIWTNLLAVYIIWGSTYLAIRFAVETMPPFLMASVRHLIVGVLLFGWQRLRGQPSPTMEQWRGAAIVGTFLLVGANGVVSWAEQRVPSGLAALLLGAVPLWIVILEAVRPGGQRPGRWALAGVLIGFAGVAALIGPSRLTGIEEHVDLIGAFAVLGAALSWSIGSIYGRGAPSTDSPLLNTGMQSLAAGAVLMLVAAISGDIGRVDIGAISPRSVGSFAYLIVFGSCIGFAAYGWLIRSAPMSLVSTYAYVNPLVAIILGNLLAAEPLTPRVLLAALLILGSVALITRAKQPSPQEASPIPTAAEPG
jgi:drug/metabolite transporter (DMT)-like permease